MWYYENMRQLTKNGNKKFWLVSWILPIALIAWVLYNLIRNEGQVAIIGILLFIIMMLAIKMSKPSTF